MTIRDVLWAAVLCIFLVVCTYLMGSFVYQSEQFEATVEDIAYYGAGGLFGSSKIVVSFDDGRVYNLYEIPGRLRENHRYLLEYRSPYLIRSPYLVIVGE